MYESECQSLQIIKNQPFESTKKIVEPTTEPVKTEKQIDKNLEVNI